MAFLVAAWTASGVCSQSGSVRRALALSAATRKESTVLRSSAGTVTAKVRRESAASSCRFISENRNRNILEEAQPVKRNSAPLRKRARHANEIAAEMHPY